ncbi:class I tRNA ligase family protein, partial [Yeosuana sp.]|uniref:class I tRNA ligase family protein n=1 Tax=Yeosuana sp. TaxID=2529388 RepID=UPI0040552B98
RYWGEPFPVYYVNGMPQMIDAKHLPIKLPEVEKYLPTETGEPPLGNAKKWYWLQYNDKAEIVSKEQFENSSPSGRLGGALELNTMPGWAGSSQYFNRYMDPNNDHEIFSKEAIDYWQQVDLYIGGSEHATGHLLYSRFWQKFMFDKGVVPVDEFAKKLINQGMILGESAKIKSLLVGLPLNENNDVKIYPIKTRLTFFSKNLLPESADWFKDENIENNIINDILEDIPENFDKIFGKNSPISDRLIGKQESEIIKILKGHLIFSYVLFPVDVNFIEGTDKLNIEEFLNWRQENKSAKYYYEQDRTFKVKREVEKMSKSKYNVVNPDQICVDYGADSLRLYEMFLGPLEQYKPWNTAGITGVHSFLKKLWRLYHQGENECFFVDSSPLGKSDGAREALKTLHKTIKKVEEDIENFSFNTSVSTFMIAVNELTAQKCTSKEILEPLLIVLSPYAPHIAEELWNQLGHNNSISTAPFPKFDASYLVESTKNYPISFNGKMRFTLELPLDLTNLEIEKAVMAHEKTQTQLEGRTPKKVVVVPGKIVNIVG